MNDFTDIHQHLVYATDDGPTTFEKTRAMLEDARRNGIGTVIATPHVTPGIQAFDLEAYHRKLETITAYCTRELPDIQVLPGAEIFYTEATSRLLKERQIPTLANTDFVLVEFSPDIRFEALSEAALSLLRAGFRPILAHVERYECLAHHPRRAYALKAQMEVRYQINCATILAGKGFRVNRFCKKLLRDHLVDAVATDAHNTSTRPIRMREAYDVLVKDYGEAYASRLTGREGGVMGLPE